jgi:hypothetical protein
MVTKTTPKQVVTLHDIAEACKALPGGSEKWAEELIEVMARRVCKSRPDLPSWSALTAAQRAVCRRSAIKNIEAMVRFFQQKLDEEK